MEITIDASPREAYVGETVRVWGEVTEAGMPVSDQDVTLFVNGSPVKTTKTDESGKYEFKIVFNKEGIYEIYTETEKVTPIGNILKWVSVAAIILTAGAGVAYGVSKARKRGKE